MFTGIIEEIGQVVQINTSGGTRRITVDAGGIAKQLKEGGSVAVSGVCLTALDVTPKGFSADLAEETWSRTALSRIHEGARVNLELPLRLDGRLDGHIVQGHVDGTGKFLEARQNPGAEDFWMYIEIPEHLEKYVVFKGSIAIEGISLTVVGLDGLKATIAVIPHTIKMTNLAKLKPGDPVNIETDLVAKYLEKWLRNGIDENVYGGDGGIRNGKEKV
jgi:riboflavin synthase